MNTALIVEPRFLYYLPVIIEKFRVTLGESWKIVFYCGKDLSAKWRELIHSSIEIRELDVIDYTGYTYSDFFKKSQLWESLYGEFVLVFQADTWIMNTEPYTIDFFLKLDQSYIGGNMEHIWDEFDIFNIPKPKYCNLNGGLSLRKRQHMIDVIHAFPPIQTVKSITCLEETMEDVYFALGCRKLNYPIGDNEDSKYFAINNIFYPKFFGIHQPNNEIKFPLIEMYPELKNHPYLSILPILSKKVIYRISESRKCNYKIKPKYVTKRGIFLHFIHVFSDYDIYVIADNIDDSTFSFLSNHINPSKILRTNLSNAGSFMYAINFAINNFKNNDIVYFAEDDYIYKKNAPMIIEEGLNIGHYVSGYDHLDKYVNAKDGGNPFIEYGGEITRVTLTKNSHWKITNSCCLTFGTKIKYLKEDLNLFLKHGPTTNDFQLFLDLKNIKNKTLISPIPGVSTHGETYYMSPLINWEKEYYDNLPNKNMNTALIIEPRFLDYLPTVIEKFRVTLGDSWKIVFYCGKDLSTKWKELIHPSVEIRELDVTNLSGYTYSDFLKQSELWQSLYGEFVLVFQADTWIMNTEPYTIDFFLKLDKSYIGGNLLQPWAEFNILNVPIPEYRNFNGGLSLRKRKHMIDIIHAFPPKTSIYPITCLEDTMEDVYFSFGCYKLNYPVGDNEDSNYFSIHTIFYPKFFGIHGPHHKVKTTLLKVFPELQNHPYINSHLDND